MESSGQKRAENRQGRDRAIYLGSTWLDRGARARRDYPDYSVASQGALSMIRRPENTNDIRETGFQAETGGDMASMLGPMICDLGDEIHN
jgi:hypothetical protein